MSMLLLRLVDRLFGLRNRLPPRFEKALGTVLAFDQLAHERLKALAGDSRLNLCLNLIALAFLLHLASSMALPLLRRSWTQAAANALRRHDPVALRHALALPTADARRRAVADQLQQLGLTNTADMSDVLLERGVE